MSTTTNVTTDDLFHITHPNLMIPLTPETVLRHVLGDTVGIVGPTAAALLIRLLDTRISKRHREIVTVNGVDLVATLGVGERRAYTALDRLRMFGYIHLDEPLPLIDGGTVWPLTIAGKAINP